MKKTFFVVYAKGDSNFSGYAPDIPGCVSAGETLEEMRANMKEALEFQLEGMAEDHEAMPEPTTVKVGFTDNDFADGVAYFIVEKLDIDVPNVIQKPTRLSA